MLKGTILDASANTEWYLIPQVVPLKSEALILHYPALRTLICFTLRPLYTIPAVLEWCKRPQCKENQDYWGNNLH